MPQRIAYAEWRSQNEGTQYPFSPRATMTSDDGNALLEGVLLDAILYPIGGGASLYLSSVVIDHQSVTLRVGDPGTPQLCSATFPLIGPPPLVSLVDANGMPAGALVAGPVGFGLFQSWGVGTHAFTPANSEFAATVCVPTPEVGVRGILLDDGTLMTGDVWLVGDDGVVLSASAASLPGGCGSPAPATAIRVDVVGDPLFRRRLCQPTTLFSTPAFVTQLRFLGPNGEDFTCPPDAAGNVMIVAGNSLAADTVLRVGVEPGGLRVGAVGSSQT